MNGRGRLLVRDEACLVPGCEGDPYSRGWCRSHYQRWRRTGETVSHWSATSKSTSTIAEMVAPFHEQVALAVIFMALRDHQDGHNDLTEWFTEGHDRFYLGFLLDDDEDISHWHQRLLHAAGIEAE